MICPSRDLGNRTLYRRASFAGVERFSWRVVQTDFRAYTTRGSRGKVFGTFRLVRVGACARALHFLVTLGKMNFAHRWIILFLFCWCGLIGGQIKHCVCAYSGTVATRLCRWNVLNGYASKNTHVNELQRSKDTRP